MGDQSSENRAQNARSADLDDLVGYNLKRAYVVVRSDFRNSVGAGGLSPRVFAALSLTMDYPNITQSELARAMGIERSGLVGIVDDLEQRGFVVRTSVPGDRRVQAVVPTETGRTAYANALATVRAHEDSLFEGWTQDERRSLLGLLKKLRASEVLK